MNKISLIIQQEYLSRVKKKSFILMTLLTPLLFIAVMLVPTWLAKAGDNEHRNIVIADQTGLYEKCIYRHRQLLFPLYYSAYNSPI